MYSIQIITGQIIDYEEIFSLLPDTIKIHSYHVAEYATILYKKACELNAFPENSEISKDYYKLIYKVFKYHDIGKVLITNDILTKKDLYTSKEHKILEDHTTNINIIYENAHKVTNKKKPADPIVLAYTYDVAIAHHERWDGRGYPCGWNEENIPLLARICSLAEVYEEITSNRNYKLPNTHEYAVVEIVKNSGLQFDPKIVDIFLKCNNDFEKMYERTKIESKNSLKKTLHAYYENNK